MPYVALKDGNKMWYNEEGKGAPVIFIHGFLGSSWLFEKQVDYFGQWYHAMAFDHLGHGKSDKPDKASYTLPQLAENLDYAVGKLIGDEKFLLVGHSMGGMIAQMYATTPKFSKRLRGLVLMSTAPKLKNPGLDEYVKNLKSGKMRLSDRSLIETVFVALCFQTKYAKEHRDLIKEFVDLTMLNKEQVGLATMYSIVDDYNVENKLGTISVPTLILTGDKDVFIPPESSKLMHEKIKNSELKVLSPNIGHMIQFEATEQYHKALQDFLKKLS
nr:alpha/beta hydrolase [Candidatus Njordarchaeota archaeon]